MAQCISPFYKKESGLSFPCGKCYPCKSRRISGWSFRILKEAERSDSALFVTLTYDNKNVPITKNKFMTLCKRDVQLFMKRLRTYTERSQKNTIWGRKIKYYLCGEYGGETRRPHYHLILFNAEYHNIQEAWKLGSIHYGTLTAASASYTLKYISKDSSKTFKNDDRQKEFSLMSKGLGSNYLTPTIISWHRQPRNTANQDLYTERFMVTAANGVKIALPRYYKNKIWTPFELQLIGSQFSKKAQETWENMSDQEKFAFDKKNAETAQYYAEINKESRLKTSL